MNAPTHPAVRRRSHSVLLAAALICSGCSQPDAPPPAPNVGVSILGALTPGSTEGFQRVTGPADLVFPRDHGPHEEHQIEWWYFTGNLADPGGRPFGFQVTFFRTALMPPQQRRQREGSLATQHLWMAHFALTDGGQEGRFRSRERFSRQAAGLAGGQAAPFRVWTGPWNVASTSETSFFPLRLQCAVDESALELELTSQKPWVLQGDRGYSRKGVDPGNASHYVSATRLRADGRLVLDGQTFEVQGSAWMDHEWSTSALDPTLAGWDWFSIQLDDGRELMLYHLRQRDGRPGPFSSGALIDQDGNVTTFPSTAFDIAVTETWTSPATGVTYPAGWRLTVPEFAIDLTAKPLIGDQELRLKVVYWEGAIRLVESVTGRASGRGYAELVGYSDTPAPTDGGSR